MMRVRLVFFGFAAMALLEIAVFILIGRLVGIGPTLLGVVLMSLGGALLIRRQGMSALGSIQTMLARGALPGLAIGDAVLLGLAGALLFVPGYLSGLAGILLLIPALRRLLLRQFATRVGLGAGNATATATGFAASPTGQRTIELDDDEFRPS